MPSPGRETSHSCSDSRRTITTALPSTYTCTAQRATMRSLEHGRSGWCQHYHHPASHELGTHWVQGTASVRVDYTKTVQMRTEV
jgi:hypothetical protein